MVKAFLLFSALLVIPASAVSIAINDTSGITTNYIRTNTGNPVPNGSALIRLGYFNTSAQLSSWTDDLKSDDLARINSALSSFVPFGEGGANLGDTPATGSAPRFATRGTIDSRLIGGVQNIVSVSGSANSVSAQGVPAGSRIFMLVYSDTNSSLSVGEQLGVFSSTTWLIDSDNSAASVLLTTDVDSSEIFRGSSVGGALRLAAIPEPSISFLALGALAAGVRRRR